MSLPSLEQLEKSGLISKKTHAVYDYEFIKKLKSIPWSDWMMSPHGVRCQQDYLSFYEQWIKLSQLNKIHGLDRFTQKHIINGTTQSFDEAFFRYKNRRLRFFRGEYAYHRRVVSHWAYLEDCPLEKEDYIIISAPFCTTGEVHPLYSSIMDVATHMNVPVLIDCAYFGTCENLDLNLNYPCIESVSFSLSKGLGLGDIRSGIRFSHFDDEYPIAQQNRYGHTVLAAARIGLYMMEHFHPDFIPLKYSAAQKEVCIELGLKPTPCMHLALGDNTDQWETYKIDDIYQRVGIRNLVKARFKGEI